MVTAAIVPDRIAWRPGTAGYILATRQSKLNVGPVVAWKSITCTIWITCDVGAVCKSPNRSVNGEVLPGSRIQATRHRTRQLAHRVGQTVGNCQFGHAFTVIRLRNDTRKHRYSRRALDVGSHGLQICVPWILIGAFGLETDGAVGLVVAVLQNDRPRGRRATVGT